MGRPFLLTACAVLHLATPFQQVSISFPFPIGSMYNLSELSPYSTLQMQMAMSTTQADANSHVPKTPEIINTLMAMTHPLDNVPLVKLEGNNTDANVPSVKLEENNTDDNNVPKTPEIINSLMAITNPLDSYVAGSSVDMNATSRVSSAKSALERFGISDKNMTDKVSNGPLQSPTTVQNMCSQLIKEELKVTLQRKKREHLLSSSSSACSPVEYTDLSIMSDCSSSSKNSNGRRIESVDTEEEDQEDGSCHSGTDVSCQIFISSFWL